MRKLLIILLLSIPVGAQTIIQTSAQLGMKCDGVTDDTQRFLNALGIGSGVSNVYIIFVNGTCNIKSINPITVPSTITLDFTQAGALSLASGSSMTVNAAIVDQDNHAIFTGLGTYTISPRNGVNCTAISGGTACQSSATGGGNQPGVFNILTYGGVDDNSTDNCANGAVAALTTAVAAYAGPGTPVVIIPYASGGKAYKLATNSNSCHFEFDKPVTIHLWGGINCAQTAANCIQFGASGLGAQAFSTTSYLDGGGNMTGGANLTVAGIEMEPFNNNTVISDIQFFNFGATNATAGACTNYAIQFDPLVFEGTVHDTAWQYTDLVANRCAYNNAGATGENTIFFYHNTLSGAGGSGIPPTTCGSVGINEGGYYGAIHHNNLYGFAADIRLAGFGTRVESNTLDSAQCALSGVTAPIQWGARSATTTVDTNSILGNNVESGHNPRLFAKAGDTNAGSAIQNIQLVGNQATNGAVGTQIDDNSPCVVNTTAITPCYQAQNTSLPIAYPCGNTHPGWLVEGVLALCGGANQTSNFPSTLAVPATTTLTVVSNVQCDVVLITAATTSSTLPTCNVSYTDNYSSTVITAQVTPAWASNTPGCTGTTTNTVGNSCSGSVSIYVKAGAAINFSTSNYASVGGTAMAYSFNIKVRLN